MFDIHIYLSILILFFQKIRLANILPTSSVIILAYPFLRTCLEFLSINSLSLETKALLFNTYIIEIFIFLVLIFLFKKYIKINPKYFSSNLSLNRFDLLFIIISLLASAFLSFIFSNSGASGDIRNQVYRGLGPIRYLFTTLNFITLYGCINKLSKFGKDNDQSFKPNLYWLILSASGLIGIFSGSKKGLLVLLPLIAFYFINNFNFNRLRKAFISKKLIITSTLFSVIVVPTLIIVRLRTTDLADTLWILQKRIQYSAGYNFFLDRFIVNNGITKENPFQENVFSFITYYFSRSDISMNIGNNLKSLALNKDVIGGPVANSIKSYFLISSQDPFSFSMFLFCLNHILFLLCIGYVVKFSALKDSFIMNGITLSLSTFLFTSFYDAYVLYSVITPILFVYFGYVLILQPKKLS